MDFLGGYSDQHATCDPKDAARCCLKLPPPAAPYGANRLFIPPLQSPEYELTVLACRLCMHRRLYVQLYKSFKSIVHLIDLHLQNSTKTQK